MRSSLFALLTIASSGCWPFGEGRAQVPMDYDKAVWTDEAAIYEEPHPRLRMVDDLLDGLLTQGVPRSEVLELLGPPTDTSHFADRDLVYWLGPEPSMISVDSAWLVMDFDGDERLSRVKIVTD